MPVKQLGSATVRAIIIPNLSKKVLPKKLHIKIILSKFNRDQFNNGILSSNTVTTYTETFYGIEH